MSAKRPLAKSACLEGPTLLAHRALTIFHPSRIRSTNRDHRVTDRWSSDPGDAPRASPRRERRTICEAWLLMRPDGEEWGGLRGSASYTALPCSEPPPTHPR